MSDGEPMDAREYVGPGPVHSLFVNLHNGETAHILWPELPSKPTVDTAIRAFALSCQLQEFNVRIIKPPHGRHWLLGWAW